MLELEKFSSTQYVLAELQNNANPNSCVDSEGNISNPLMFCIEYKKYEALKLLLEYEADPEVVVKSDEGEVSRTPIQHAIFRADLKAVEIFLDACPDLAKQSESVLKYACILNEKNLSKILEFLIERGANPNQFFNDGATPLIVSISNSNGLSNVKTLIRLGADVNLPDNLFKGGGSPLKWALELKDTEQKKSIIRLLEKKGARNFLLEEDRLVMKVEEKFFAIDPDSQSKSSKTGLHDLAKDGSRDGVNGLIELLKFWKDNLKESKDPDGKIYIDAFATLKYKKSSESYATIDDVTPLYIAVNNSNSLGASLLIKNMADPNHKVKKYSDEAGETLEGEYSIFELAIERAKNPLRGNDVEKAYDTLGIICKGIGSNLEILKEARERIIKYCAKDSRIHEILSNSFPKEIALFQEEINLKKLKISEGESVVADSNKPSSRVGIGGVVNDGVGVVKSGSVARQ